MSKLFVFDEERNLHDMVSAVGKAMYPVGSIKITVDEVNPQTYFKGTTWVKWASGRTLVGVDATKNQFNAPMKAGGSLEVPKHSHKVIYTGDTPPMPSGREAEDQYIYHDAISPGGEYSGEGQELHYVWTAHDYDDHNERGEASLIDTFTTYQKDGQTLPGKNNPLITEEVGNADMMPPYITCYFWRRTA